MTFANEEMRAALREIESRAVGSENDGADGPVFQHEKGEAKR